MPTLRVGLDAGDEFQLRISCGAASRFSILNEISPTKRTLRLFIYYSRMLKKSASGVLASFRGSTYQGVRLASSLAAALLDGLFEHPVVYGVVRPFVRSQPRLM
jgi:hypothetical protein